MCGIAGAFHPKLLTNSNVGAMTKRLSHRGPDDQCIDSFMKGDSLIAEMGTARLSIIAPNNGQQPIVGPRFALCMNGEIYNHESLRREALANGSVPENDSDAAVVAALLAFLPVNLALRRLRGMFAISVVDKEKGELWLIRDRMGQKPLYWGTRADGTTLWASELRVLAQERGLDKRRHNDAIAAYFMLEYIPAPLTPYRGIQKLQAGHLVHFTMNGSSNRSWWTPPQISNDIDRDLNPWKKAFSYAFADAVRLRSAADTAISSVISGGLDSGAVASYASEKKWISSAFTASVIGKGFDESRWATETASTLGLDLTTVRVDQEILSQARTEAAIHFDEPLADGSKLPSWELYKCIKNSGFKCVLSGDGADESLAGYPTYLAHQLRPFAKMGRGLLGKIVNALPVSEAGVSWDYMAKRFTAALNGPWWKNQMIWMGAWTPDEIQSEQIIWKHIESIAAMAGQGALGQAMYLDQRLYLSECVLTKVDRCSMAFGVEVRSPFLDHRLVELMATLPRNAKLHKGRSKIILKQIMRNRLPDSIINRRKKGFGAPLSNTIRQFDRAEWQQIKADCAPWVGEETFDKTWNEHIQGVANHRRRLWTALTYSDWLKHHNHFDA